MFKNEGGGVNGCLNNVQKNCGFGFVGHPLLEVLVDNLFNPGASSASVICTPTSFREVIYD